MRSVSRRPEFTKSPAQFALLAILFIGLIPYGYAVGGILRITSTLRPVFALTTALAVVSVANLIVPKVWHWILSSANVTTFFMHYSADRPVTVSHVEAMISAGDYEAATREIDALLFRHGAESEVCRVALDFHLGKFGSRERAVEILWRMRQENSEKYELLATQRLIDVYLAQPGGQGKALSELRRIVARFPGTPDAAGAALAIQELKGTGVRISA
jgi:hypothetical protein